jgi:hypothetical protein
MYVISYMNRQSLLVKVYVGFGLLAAAGILRH